MLALSLALSAFAPLATANVVTDWNQRMLDAAVAANSSPFAMTRTTALVHVAVFDAVNGIERRYAPIVVTSAAPALASPHAAAIEAAAVMLQALFPAQQANLEAERTRALDTLRLDTTTTSAAAIAAGTQWGRFVANQVFASRQDDGFTAVIPPYLGGTAVGQWRPTPPASTPAGFIQFATMKPWALRSPSQFRLSGAPAVTSATYTADFQEVKRLGSTTSTERTAEQTLVAQFWGTLPPAYFWNRIANRLAISRQLSLSESAQLFAQLNVAIADATIACFDTKQQFAFWRPVTAIRAAADDGNADTTADATWTSIVVTPPFPEYPSAHSTVSAAAAEILSTRFGPDVAFGDNSYAQPAVTRSFTRFSAALAEISDARVCGGVHFRTACRDGEALGSAVARQVLATTALTPQRIAHVSTRGRISTEETVLITGFTLVGDAPARRLIRVAGPALTTIGLSGALADPTFEVYQGSTVVASNDDWVSTDELDTFTRRWGALPFAPGSKDAAILAALPPGNYTVVARSATRSAGVCLIEVFEGF